jgi:hypothetical protein
MYAIAGSHIAVFKHPFVDRFPKSCQVSPIDSPSIPSTPISCRSDVLHSILKTSKASIRRERKKVKFNTEAMQHIYYVEKAKSSCCIVI